MASIVSGRKACPLANGNTFKNGVVAMTRPLRPLGCGSQLLKQQIRNVSPGFFACDIFDFVCVKCRDTGTAVFPAGGKLLALRGAGFIVVPLCAGVRRHPGKLTEISWPDLPTGVSVRSMLPVGRMQRRTRFTIIGCQHNSPRLIDLRHCIKRFRRSSCWQFRCALI